MYQKWQQAVSSLPGDPVARAASLIVGIGFLVGLAAVSLLCWAAHLRMARMERRLEQIDKNTRPRGSESGSVH